MHAGYCCRETGQKRGADDIAFGGLSRPESGQAINGILMGYRVATSWGVGTYVFFFGLIIVCPLNLTIYNTFRPKL